MIGEEEIGKIMKTLNAIWFAMLGSLAIYLVIALQVQEQLKTSLDANTFAVVRSVLYLLALVTFFMTGYVRRKVLSAKGDQRLTSHGGAYPSRNRAVQRYTSAMMVALAMSESVGIYGLLLFFLGKNAIDLFLLILVSAVAMFIYRPKREELAGLSRDDPGEAIQG